MHWEVREIALVARVESARDSLRIDLGDEQRFAVREDACHRAGCEWTRLGEYLGQQLPRPGVMMMDCTGLEHLRVLVEQTDDAGVAERLADLPSDRLERPAQIEARFGIGTRSIREQLDVCGVALRFALSRFAIADVARDTDYTDDVT